MFAEYIAAALEQAEYEIIDDPEPFYAHVPGLQGVWATGKPLKNAAKNSSARLRVGSCWDYEWGNLFPNKGQYN